MPKPLNRTKPVSRKAKAAEDKNSRAIVKAFKDGDGAFARVEKEIGFGQFYLRYFDGVQVHEQILATPRGVFFAGGKVRVRISSGDIVLVDGIQMLGESKKKGQTLVVQIIGKLEKKEAADAFKEGRISREIFQEAGAAEAGEEELFDYSGEEEQKEGEEEDVDIDAI